MKNVFLICVFIAFYTNGYSQQVCDIVYQYDANGCRIKRYQDCYNPYENPQTHPPKFPLKPTLFPNPTIGKFTVSLNELVKKATWRIINMEGKELDYKVQENVYERDFDITNFVPGSYIVTVSVLREEATEEENYELTVIKY